MRIDVNFTKYHESLKTKKEGEKTFIFDPIRNKYLVLEPEEHVRQLVVQYLIHEKNFPKTRIKIEKGLKVNTLAKRCDILIYNQNMNPVFLVECKSHKVPINAKTFEQIARYNLTFQVQYLLVTNGVTAYCCKMDYKQQSFSFLDEIPLWGKIQNTSF
jgi:hypothetical protein